MTCRTHSGNGETQALLHATPSFLSAPIGTPADLRPGRVALAGVFCDHFGDGQPGSRFAPRQLRYLARRERAQGDPRATPHRDRVIDIGDLKVFPLQPLRNARALVEQSERIASSGARLLAIGGDYSVTPHLVEGLVRARPGQSIGLIRVSRRADFQHPGCALTRPGATFRIRDALGGKNANIVLVGVAPKITAEELANAASACVIPMRAITGAAQEQVDAAVCDLLTRCDAAYLSVDADILSPLHGATSAPRPAAGLSPAQLASVLGRFAQVPLAGADVMGHVPDLDLTGTASTTVAAAIVSHVTDLMLGAGDGV